MIKIMLQTFESHGCEVQVGGVERDLAYLYVLLDRKVSLASSSNNHQVIIIIIVIIFCTSPKSLSNDGQFLFGETNWWKAVASENEGNSFEVKA